MIEWGPVASWAAAFIAFLAINASTLQWLLKRREDARFRDVTRIEEIARYYYELKAELPIEYVRREDWIRFGSTIDAKMDGMREEIREDLLSLKIHCPMCEAKVHHG